MLLFVFLMPIIITLIVWLFYKHKFHWIELIIPTLCVGIFTLISYNVQKMDAWSTEFNGHLIVETRYYEYWESYVHKTCSRQVACGSETYRDSQGRSQTRTKYCTEYYDCSYCDETPERFELISREGKIFPVEKAEYLRLMNLWNSKEYFKELNRNITKYGSCGKDGNMYYVVWDRNPMTVKSVTTTHKYQNYLKYNTSIFNYPKIDSLNAKTLYNYPYLDGYYQNAVLGLESLSIHDSIKNQFSKNLEYFNAANGSSHKLRYYTLFFKDKDLNIAKLQEAKWLGGNQNEMVICIGTNGTKLNWVYAFGWCDNKLTHVNLREDLMQNDSIYLEKFIQSYQKSKETFKYKNFKDFDYIHFEPTKKQLLFIFIGSFLITVISLLVVTLNKFNNEE